MKLDFFKRILLVQILPETGGLQDQIISSDIRKKVALTQEDFEKIEFKVEEQLVNGQTVYREVWNKDKLSEVEIDVDFTGAEVSFLKECVVKLDESKSVTIQLVDICKEIKDL